MWRTQIRDEESKIEAEKRIKYKGTARIRLKWLHFQWNQPRELDTVIDQPSLDAAEERSGVSAWQLGKYPQGGYPELVFPAGYQVECLHGRHRIQAAKELGLDWWTVDLYLADVDPNLRTCLAEEYANAKKPNDGEIYRKIRLYHFQQNLRFEWRWWSRLSPHGKRCLRQLLRHEELTAALDALCGIPGLWGGMRLHTWNTILATRCDDVSGHSSRRHRFAESSTGNLAQKEVDWIIEKAREHPSFQSEFCEVDMSQVCSYIFCRVGNGLTPEKLNSLSTFIVTTLTQFPTLTSIRDYAIAETLYLLWFSEYPGQHYDRTQLEVAQNLFKVLPDRLQHAQPREFTVVIFLGLRAVAHILGSDSNRPLALDPYIAFCSLMGDSRSLDKEAILDRMCSSMLAKLRQLEDVDLERFAIYYMGGTEADTGISLSRSYCQYRLANPPVAHEEAKRHLATRMAVESWQAHQGFHEMHGGLEETLKRDAAQI